MARDWKELKAEIDAAADAAIEDCPHDMLRVFEYEIIRTGAGTGNLTMGPWWEGATSTRYLGSYFIYNIIKLIQDSDISIEKTKQLVNLMLPKALGTVKLSGMESYARFTEETIDQINNHMDNRDDIQTLLTALWFYGSAVNAWCQYRIKWGLGLAFPAPTREDLEYMGSRAHEAFVKE